MTKSSLVFRTEPQVRLNSSSMAVHTDPRDSTSTALQANISAAVRKVCFPLAIPGGGGCWMIGRTTPVTEMTGPKFSLNRNGEGLRHRMVGTWVLGWSTQAGTRSRTVPSCLALEKTCQGGTRKIKWLPYVVIGRLAGRSVKSVQVIA